MKINRWGNKRIAHTKTPIMETCKEFWNHPQLDVSFFYKIKGSVRLLEPSREMQRKQIEQELFGTRFSISKRLQALSKSRMRKKRNSLTARDNQRPFNTIQLVSHRVNSLHIPKPNQSQDIELSNINKTISGTRIGALSSLQIMKNLDEEEKKKQQKQLLSYNQHPNPLQSESYEQIFQKQGQNFSFINSAKNVYIRSNIKLKPAKKGKNNEELLQSIFGGQQFLQKHKEYQTILMEKSTYYKSKRLSLDYKNEWRI